MTDRERTVFHVPESDEAYGRGALRNVANLLADDSIDPAVAIVFNGGGIEHVLADAPTADRVRELLEAGVEVCVCRNTLGGSDHTAEDLLDGTVLVSSGMGELTRKQTAGYAYVRP